MSEDERPEGSPEALQGRIDRLRAGQERGTEQRKLSHALVFFMSMGATMIGSIYGGYVIGMHLNQRTGSEMWLPIMLLVGVAGGASVVWQLLKPMLK